MRKKIGWLALGLVFAIGGMELFGASFGPAEWTDQSETIESRSEEGASSLAHLNVRFELAKAKGPDALTKRLQETFHGVGVGAARQPASDARAVFEIELFEIDEGGWNPVSKQGAIAYSASFVMTLATDDAPRVYSGRIRGKSTVALRGWHSRRGVRRFLVQRVSTTIRRRFQSSLRSEIERAVTGK